MNNWFLMFSFFLLVSLSNCKTDRSPETEKNKSQSQEESQPEQGDLKDSVKSNPADLLARIKTEKGDILINLFYEKTPLTVANFVALAEGNMPNAHREVGEPYFDGLTFHRVVPNFVIQGGDPLATGTGNPGYRFQDEFTPTLNHNKAGMVSMANSGPNTNGSQFFITLKPIPNLNAKHAVFGEVIEGMDVVQSISEGDEMKEIEILRKSEAAKDFKAKEIFYQRSFETYETP
jgi:cyclophilin family peptidyl-prolyl cis-trans isomerase